jgi:uracil-DNA glycosylase
MISFHRDYDFIQKHLRKEEFQKFYNNLGNINPKKELLFKSFNKSLKEVDLVFVSMFPKLNSTGNAFFSNYGKTKEQILLEEIGFDFEALEKKSLFLNIVPTYDYQTLEFNSKEWKKIVESLITTISIISPKIWIYVGEKVYIKLFTLIRNNLCITDYPEDLISSIPINHDWNYVANMSIDNIDKNLLLKINKILKHKINKT